MILNMSKCVEITVLVIMKETGFFTQGQFTYNLIVEVVSEGEPIPCEVEWHLMYVEKIDLNQVKSWKRIGSSPFSYVSTSSQ